MKIKQLIQSGPVVIGPPEWPHGYVVDIIIFIYFLQCHEMLSHSCNLISSGALPTDNAIMTGSGLLKVGTEGLSAMSQNCAIGEKIIPLPRLPPPPPLSPLVLKQ